MADIVQAKRRAGATVNDVCLAAVAGALRELALLRREQPQPLKAMVPVSVRGDEQRGTSATASRLRSSSCPSRSARARGGSSGCRGNRRLQVSGRPAGTGAVLGALGLLPDPIKDRLRAWPPARACSTSPSRTSRAPRFPLYMLGAELTEAYPVVPDRRGPHPLDRHVQLQG